VVGVFSLWVCEGRVGLRLVYLMGFVVYIVVYIWSGWKVGFVRLFEKSESTCLQYLGMWFRYMWTSSWEVATYRLSSSRTEDEKLTGVKGYGEGWLKVG
jgi:hypothetical protein